ncbi:MULTISPECIES: hypothetical protein [Roseobacteraceae]|uniref:hypothetical protein n=1 Tax=Roseobacteraceae TaxID=2854170 RepID=UPI00058C9F55|nr:MULTISPECIES: hypothetical protein [Roseobacteraceae]KAB6716091.1 hypothetical protein C8029_11580 [Roseobacter sp. TSBP12]
MGASVEPLSVSLSILRGFGAGCNAAKAQASVLAQAPPPAYKADMTFMAALIIRISSPAL